MEPYTLDRNFQKQDLIDTFHSVIWTERYYGDSEVELVVPATMEMIEKMPIGIFLGLRESSEVMILETMNIEKDELKVTGISLLPWLNNRFVRASATHKDQNWLLTPMPPGEVLWTIVRDMCVAGSSYLNGTINTGITDPQLLAIPGLGLRDYDKAGDNITVSIPYGPVYDALREIATTYQIGMQITLDSVTDISYSLGFRSYRGLDHTSDQTDNPIIRFSPQMDSLTDIKELQSIAALKTLVYAFAPQLTDPLPSTPGMSSMTETQYTGFDLRALQVFETDISSDTIAGSQAKLLEILNSRALDARVQNRFIRAVDGEIVPTNQFQYGVHYNLGDLIEVQGNAGIVKTSRITEYIRSQDESGEKAYPTVAMLD